MGKNEHTLPLMIRPKSKLFGTMLYLKLILWLFRFEYFEWSCLFYSSAIQAPLKLKAPRGAPTPINRNQVNQPRSASALLGKRPFDNVSITYKDTSTFPQLENSVDRSKCSHWLQTGGNSLSTNGRPFALGMRAANQSVIKRQKVSQGDAPNPVVFVATKDTRYVSKTSHPHVFAISWD